jgi:hypothetical protein
MMRQDGVRRINEIHRGYFSFWSLPNDTASEMELPHLSSKWQSSENGAATFIFQMTQLRKWSCHIWLPNDTAPKIELPHLYSKLHSSENWAATLIFQITHLRKWSCHTDLPNDGAPKLALPHWSSKLHSSENGAATLIFQITALKMELSFIFQRRQLRKWSCHVDLPNDTAQKMELPHWSSKWHSSENGAATLFF